MVIGAFGTIPKEDLKIKGPAETIKTIAFFFTIQRVKARAIPCPHQLPTRVIIQFR